MQKEVEQTQHRHSTLQQRQEQQSQVGKVQFSVFIVAARRDE